MFAGLIGQKLDRYEIVGRLGEGSLGAVFRARDSKLEREVAIKVLRPEFAGRRELQDLFLADARIAVRLRHPGVLRAYDFGQSGPHVYIVTEYLPGGHLGRLFKAMRDARQWLTLPEALQFARHVGQALEYVHQRGLLYRLLKPENILIRAEASADLPYQPVLADLGLARLYEASGLRGAPAYESPEQARGEPADARSDLYSFGVLLYELTLGRLPFYPQTDGQTAGILLQETPPAPRSLHPNLPASVEAIILKALAQNPGDRFASAEALTKALEAALPEASQVKAPPPVFEAEAGLMAVYMRSLQQAPTAESEAGATTEAIPTVGADVGQDKIQILDPDHTTRDVAMRPGGLTIGRGPDNDIVIDHAKVSRYHARIEFDGKDYRVTDLKSTNGTFLGANRLLPEVPQPWDTETALHVGGSYLRLNRVRTSAALASTLKQTVVRPGGGAIDPSQIVFSRGAGRVGVYVDTPRLSVLPGANVFATLFLLNAGPTEDRFVVTVAGVPTEWTPNLPGPIGLAPGKQEEVRLMIQPPRTPQSRAGRNIALVRVASQSAPNEIVETKVTVMVGAFGQFTSELQPAKVRAGQRAQVVIQNEGNLPETFTVTLNDRGDELRFNPPEVNVTAPEGQVASADFRAAPRQRKLTGENQSYSYSAVVKAASGKEKTHTGELVAGGTFPAWALWALGIGLAGLAVFFLGYAFLGDFFNPAVTPTQVAIVTTVTAAPSTPKIAGLQPSTAVAGGPGFQLTVNGTNFAEKSSILWNGSPLQTTFVSATQLLAIVDAITIANTGEINVAVTTPEVGQSDILKFIVSATPVVVAPAPILQSIDPISVTVGSPDFSLAVVGSGFTISSTVRWKGSDRPTKFLNATQLSADISAADIKTADTVEVQVFTPAPGGGISSPKTFNIVNPSAPTVTATSTSFPPVAIALLPNVSPSNFGQTVVFSATVTRPGGASPTCGTVTLQEGSIALGSAVNLTTASNQAAFPIATLSVGTHKITAIYAPSVDCPFGANTSNPVDLLVNKADQTITFNALPTRTFGEPQFQVNATASSGLTVGFTANDNCTIGNALVTITGAGKCTITASQAGDSSYKPALDVPQIFTIGQASSTTTVTCPASVTYDGTAQTPCSATVTGAGGLNQPPTVNYSSNTNAGTATASASFAGDANHTGSSDSKTFTIAKANQTISGFGTISTKLAGDSFTITSVTGGTSGNAVTFSANPSNVCTSGVPNGSIISLVGSGACTVTASQAGNGNYNDAPNVPQMFTVTPALSISMSFSSVVSGTTTLTATLTITITNMNSTVAINGIAFTDQLPTSPASPGDMVVDTPAKKSATGCGGPTIFMPNPGDNLLSYSNGNIAANGTCTLAVDVSTMVQGQYTTITSPVTSSNGGTINGASATQTFP